MDIFAQQLVNALSLGGIYALLALGLAMVFSIMGLVNFAHGDLMTIGGYAIWFGAMVLGAPLIVVALLGIFAVVLGSVLMERIAFRPVRGASGTTMLLTSFAVSIVLQVLFQIFISARPMGIQLPAQLSETLNLFGVRLGVIQLTAIVVVAVALVSIIYFLRRTTLGIGMRAAAQDFPVARLMGINANRIVSTAFAISGLLAGLAAFLWIAQRGSVDPTMGLFPVIKAFIAAVLGGLGSLPGAVLGGFILGAAEVLFRSQLPESMLPFADAFTLTMVLVILMVRPQGLLGKVTERA
ncbi:branched-chain amino acid ABC transporter permease [Glaciibacter psychrotolerans]|uniref:Branched-chain amino acid transport system permease protein n=1 Tax=Glaciibacter psychrotolerans TaxID=670054 RepID=A0A7Z0J6D9_9MICO|nr:branched-chain amino acid ABC transporter permease [Leifsonia psychrotolerans]NYJ20422.1 branched-chain amino acid transport system permease protein [Leifsonia psychrotolerans]